MCDGINILGVCERFVSGQHLLQTAQECEASPGQNISSEEVNKDNNKTNQTCLDGQLDANEQ